MEWGEAVEKWAHRQVDGGRLCPVTKKVVTQTYTDHSRGGYDDGEFRVVVFNACRLCGDPDFTVATQLRKLNERRKKEV